MAVLALCHAWRNSKFKMRWFQTKDTIELESCKQVYLAPLVSDEDKTFSGSLVLELRIDDVILHILYIHDEVC